MRIYAPLCALLLATACAAGPDYVRPEVEAPEAFVSQHVLTALAKAEKEKVETTAPSDWWEGFQDPTLNQLVTVALAKNRSIQAAAARLTQAEARYRAVDANNALNIDAGIRGSAEQERGIGNNNVRENDEDLSGSIGFALPIDITGKYRRQAEAAEAEREAAVAALRGTVLAVSTEVATEYLRMRGNQRQLTLLEESVELQEKTLSIVQTRFEAGLSPELDLKRAEAAVASLKADIPAQQESLSRARNRLATLGGKFAGAYEAELQSRQPIPDYAGAIPLVLPGEVLQMRPDVQQAEAELKQAIANIGVAKSEWLPAFDLAGQISIGSASGGGATLDLLTGTLTALIEQALFDGGARSANIHAAKARAEEALAVYYNTLLEAIEEVEATLLALEASQKRQEALAIAVEANKRSFEQAESLYRQGLTSFLDVV
ncbi:MAG: efflux transporter outer membrane subunit, partial [Rickettsiales bacterium]